MTSPSHHVRFRLSRVVPVVATVTVAVALAGLLPAGPATAAPVPPIGASFFGVHHAGLHADGALGWPQATVGSVRLWDNGVAWRDLETSPGVFGWDRIDAEMLKARDHGASVLLVLGQTPRFHSTRPGAPGAYGPGATAMPTKAAWVGYVKAVARRNQTVWGGVADFQVWNEANVANYWSGTPAQMATLTVWTRAALRSVGSGARLVSPAMVTRLSSQRTWIRAFYARHVAGKKVSTYVDALSFQLYPPAAGTPETSMTLLAAVRAILRKERVSKPIWNTEANYGLLGGGRSARTITVARQIGNVMRTYVLNAQNRVARVYWYSWDLLRLSNTPLVGSDRVTLTAAGRAFGTTRTWLLGTRPAGCTRSRVNTWTCTFTTATQTRRVVWNPTSSRSLVVPARTTATTWDPTVAARSAGSRVSLGVVPVLLTTPR